MRTDRWTITYIPEAYSDLERLDGSQRKPVLSAIERVSTNPLPVSEGGYGKPLGHRHGNNLTGCLKVKLKRLGLRIVYRLMKTDKIMQVIVIGIRSDDEGYEQAAERLKKLF